MAAASPTTRPLSGDLLSRIVLQAEEAHARIERAAGELAQRRLRGARPVMGALRLKRLQLAATRWRGTALPY